MSESNRGPAAMPYLAVFAEDQGNPPRVEFFPTEAAGLKHCKSRAYHDNHVWYLFKCKRIATVHPSQPKIYSEGLDDESDCANVKERVTSSTSTSAGNES